MTTAPTSTQIDTTQSIPPGAHVVGEHIGTSVDIQGCNAVVNLSVGSVVLVGAGTIDTKIQESDDNTTFTDWAGGAFDQVSGDSDFAVYELAYTGSKRYIRTVATVLVASCDFSIDILRMTVAAAGSSSTTFAQQLLDDLDVFINSDEFAVMATYTPTSGPATTFSVLFDREAMSDMGMIANRYYCEAKTSDVLTAAPDETLQISGVTYKIKEPPQHTATGTTILELSID